MKKISIIGGDLISTKLALLLANQMQITTFALDYAEELRNNENILFANSLEEAVNYADVVIGPMPLTIRSEYITTVFSREKIKATELKALLHNKIFIAGNLWESTRLELEAQNTKVFDILANEELKILTSIITAEGILRNGYTRNKNNYT